MSKIKLILELGNNGYSNKVSAIKAIRYLTGLGLREAKHVSESTPNSIMVKYDEDIQNQIKNLRSSGLEVKVVSNDSPVNREIANELKKLVTVATLASEFDIARGLINFIELHFLEFQDLDIQNK